ncbi:MAG: O-antigen ligase family protein, partial [Candidatus Bathyarchaeota archaeon]|nr:O-antigen ligase family protein [Candidatus Bathyarchaeota archaeon]
FLYYIERNSLAYDNTGRNLIIFHQKGEGLRNSGMFWEPGAFACYINLAFLLFFGNIRSLITVHKNRLIIIILALLTTYSTTGYLIFFFLLISTVYFEFGKKLGLLIIPILIAFISAGYVVFEKSDFLKNKIENQFQTALDRDKNEFAPDRLSALIFDLHYIKKHPLTGNGMDETTRYADHPWLQEKILGHGNGFSNFIATMGILSLLFYSFYILKYKRKHSVIFIIGLFALLQGEPLLNYPLFLSIPFIFIYAKYYIRTNHLSQQEAENISISSSII